MNTEPDKKTIRCAIYTRKSTQEGLDRDFTTLDAQRESAESYIASQKSQGWITLPEKYDDGGFTGANIDRPALQRLLKDITSGKVDCAVVYKVDRLSRSLLDFTRLLELFDKHNVTFVSVTQHFNTNSSMGRLTLNILLSFAQFEREMISERTADKIGASRRKGKYTGGRPALGFDVNKENHTLITNPKEAELVQYIFDLYIREQSLLKVAEIVNAEGYRTKQIKQKTGKTSGGKLFKNTTVQWIIKNVHYIGKVSHKNEIYDGEHNAIISEEVFNKAHSVLKENTRLRSSPKRRKHLGLLSHILYCHPCNKKMLYTYTRKKTRQYKYYICQTATKHGYKHCPTKMIAAHHIENPVIAAIDIPRWDTLLFEEQRQKIMELIQKVEVDRESEILLVHLTDGTNIRLKMQSINPPNPKKEFAGLPALRQLLLLAHQIQGFLDSGKAANLKEISEWTGLSHSRICQVMNFLNLCPTIQEDIVLNDDETLRKIPEYKTRPICKEPDPQIQQSIWQKLIAH
ncbi:MAG: recombinase family protein [Candidatus Omnitrophica bacterium]|nr:recombinase family protein [Candidatus Omnitrophota bacterium]